MKRISKLSGILLLVITALVLTAVFLPNRAEAVTVDSGSCGSNVSWSISDAGVLTISGYGPMKDYSEDEMPPWVVYAKYISGINISNGVTSIGNYSFVYCLRVTSLTISGSVKTIGEGAFGLCTSLETVTIPYGVQTIKKMAFADCTSLSTVELSASVSSIGTGAFATGSKLSGIKVSDSNPYYCSDSNGALYNKSKTTLLQVPAVLDRYYEMANTTTKIEQYAFYCCKLTSVAVPAGVKTVGANAFLNCEELLQVYYRGTKTQWNGIKIGAENQALHNAKRTYKYNGPTAAKIVNMPSTLYIKRDSEAYVSVTATGTDLRYQWQKRHNNGRWYDLDGYPRTSNRIKIDTTIYNDKCQYRCYITAITGETVCTEKITVRVMGIELYPEGRYIARIGETVTMAAKVTGNPKCYWQYKRKGETEWTNLEGANRPVLKVKATSDNHNTKYRLVIEDAAGHTIKTRGAELFVLQVTKQPVSAKVTAGETAVLKVSATGHMRKFQWQFRKSALDPWEKSPAKGNNTATLKISATAGKNGYQYRCMVKDSDGNTVYSKIATMYVLRVKTQPQTAKVAAGDTAVFKVSATGHGKTYQWQYRASADSPWKNTSATGNKTATLKVPATVSRSAYQYRCVVKDSAGNTVNSKAVSLYVLGIKTQPAAAQAVAGTNAAFKVEATGHGKTYQWQYRTSPEGAWKNAAATGNKTANLKVPATVSRSGYQYRCVIKDSAGNTVYSDAATLYVLGIAAQPQTTSVAAGETAVFTVSATGYGPTYQWQYRASPEAQWQNVTEATAAQLQFTAEIGMNGYEYRCVVTDFLGNTVYSDAATLAVKELPTEDEGVL